MDVLGICVLILIIISFVLFLIRVIFIFYHNITLARELKRITRQANARQCNADNSVELSNQTGNQPPKDDFPPAYDEVMQSYVNAKLALQAAEEGQVVAAIMPQSTNLSNAQSTTTIETFVDSCVGSNNDLTNVATSTTTAAKPNISTSATVNTPTLPPTYETCMSQNEPTTSSNNNVNAS